MNQQQAQTILQNYLSAPQRNTDCFDLDQFHGAMTAVLSSPETISDIDVGLLVLGEEAGYEDPWFDDVELSQAKIVFENSLGEELALDRFDLRSRYPQLQTDKRPTHQFARWCDGYLQGYLLTESAWREAYDFLSHEKFRELEENHLAMLGMCAVLADWDVALAENEHPERLENSLPQLLETIHDGVKVVHRLALILEENRLNAKKARQTVRLGPKIGRNDPCPCGSGKKYKKCCLGKL